MTGFMNPAEFANIAKSEKHFWWYRGMRTILFRLVDPYLAGRSIGRVLEAGCGTGYFSHLLQRERGWPVVPLDFSWHGLRYAREMGVERAVQGDIRGLPFSD
ncbi:MAG: class I SAM-dependent methyltransferase, partial [Bryobacteraceae bacterium]